MLTVEKGDGIIADAEAMQSLRMLLHFKPYSSNFCRSLRINLSGESAFFVVLMAA
jgi:hypothetical protein